MLIGDFVYTTRISKVIHRCNVTKNKRNCGHQGHISLFHYRLRDGSRHHSDISPQLTLTSLSFYLRLLRWESVWAQMCLIGDENSSKIFKTTDEEYPISSVRYNGDWTLTCCCSWLPDKYLKRVIAQSMVHFDLRQPVQSKLLPQCAS